MSFKSNLGLILGSQIACDYQVILVFFDLEQSLHFYLSFMTIDMLDLSTYFLTIRNRSNILARILPKWYWVLPLHIRRHMVSVRPRGAKVDHLFKVGVHHLSLV